MLSKEAIEEIDYDLILETLDLIDNIENGRLLGLEETW